jgi:hypothetical protein
MGRKLTHDVKNNYNDYFREYYHKKNEEHPDYFCPDCNCYIKKNSLRKHKKSAKHIHLTEIFNLKYKKIETEITEEIYI